MESVEKSARTVEEAIEAGLQELGLPRDQVQLEILEEPRSLLGLLSHPARVRLTPLPDPDQQALSVLERILALSGLEASATLEQADPEQVRLVLAGKDVSLIIGKHGQTLQALQHLVNLIVNRHRSTRRRILLDAEHYRERREAALRAMALQAARRARETGREVILEPLPAIERRIVHLALQEVAGVETRSMGEDPERRVIVIPSGR